MATRFAETILPADDDRARTHRRIVRVGAAAAWTASAIFFLAGFFTGSPAMYAQTVGPAIVGAFMTVQIMLHRENGGLALFAAALVTLVLHSAVGDEVTLLPAALALVVICSIAMLLVASRQLLAVGGVALTLALAPLIWGIELPGALQLGVVMGLGFVMTSAIFLAVRNATAALNARFQTLFEHSPMAVMEEDWAEALAYVRSEYTGRPDRIRPFLMAYPAVVQRAVAKARIVRANQAAVELLEAESAEELIGYRNDSKVTEHTIEAFVGALVSLYEGRREYSQEVLALTMKGRPIWLETTSVDTSTSDPATTIIVGLADVTHMKQRQLAMADLVKAKDEFIARVSHELRTPLTAVVGLTSEMNSMEGLSEDERNEMMHLVAGQAAEMSYIVEDLLVAARAEMGTIAIEPTRIDLNAELAATIDGLGIRVQHTPDFIPAAIADPSRVRQILRNLLTNASRYGGTNRRILAGSLLDRVWLEIRDDGDGVIGEEISRIFEPYTTAHSGVKGSVGLGLSVARQLAEIMGGSLTYRRDLDETVFRLELPAAQQPEMTLTSRTASV